jgi:hypothetical protein
MSWPVRLTYIVFALALTLSLALTAAPAKVSAEPDLTKWSKVKTPSQKDEVIVDNEDIISYDTMGDGSVIYAVIDDNENGEGDHLYKSEDGGTTWDDITDEITEEGLNYPMIVQVSLTTPTWWW